MPIYLDYNATTPVDSRVVEAMLPYFTGLFGNPASRTHQFGWEAEEAVDIAREQVAALIGAQPNEMVFTSGATEAVNLAIKGIAEQAGFDQSHIITVETEHKAVLDTCKHLEKWGAKVTYLPVNADGLISLQELEQAITPETVLISVMYANNETGVIQPVPQIAEIARKQGIAFFCDATQAVGKIDVNVRREGIDLLALSAHKMYGPKGVGALYVRKNSPAAGLVAQMDGGGHERNMRSGTLNVPGIVGLGSAAELARQEFLEEGKRLRNMRDTFESELSKMGDIVMNGASANRLPHTSNISFLGVDGDRMILEAGSELAFSRASACTSATIQPSYVLLAMGLPAEVVNNSFRFSFGRFSDEAQMRRAVEVIGNIVKNHRHERNYRYNPVV